MPLRVAVEICLGSRFPMFVWWGGADLINLYNDAYIPILGSRHPEAFGRPAREVWGQVWDVAGPQVAAVFERGESTWQERMRLVVDRHGYSEEAFFTFSHTPIFDEGGAVGGLMCTVIEETTHVRAEAELEEHRERLRSVLDSSLDAAYRRDLRTDAYDYLSPATERVLGISPEVLERMPVEELAERIHPEDRTTVIGVIGDGLRSRSGRIEYRIRTDAGGYRWVADHFSVQTDAFGRPHYRTGTVRDVTERKESESKLREREREARALADALATERGKLAAVIEGLPIGIGIGDATGRTLSLNPAGLRLHGFASEAEMFARLEDYVRDFELIDLEGRPLAPDEWPVARALRGEAVRGLEVRLRNRVRQEERVVSYDIVPIRDAGGEVALFAYVMQDLTEEKRAAEALLEAKRAAERANRVKSDFMAAMSHELRTPLNAIAGYVDLLQQGIQGPVSITQRASLNRIAANQRRLVKLIEDILSFARIDTGRLEFEWRPIPADELLDSMEPLIEHHAAARGVEHEVVECGPGVVLRGDPERVRQILLNLVSNAVKFTPRGGRVSLSCDTDGEHVYVRVGDNGPGIPGDQHEAIFDAFTQVDRRLDHPQEGVGLGLTISRQLARAMEGDLTVESVPGSGSTFTLRLPRDAVSAS